MRRPCFDPPLWICHVAMLDQVPWNEREHCDTMQEQQQSRVHFQYCFMMPDFESNLWSDHVVKINRPQMFLPYDFWWQLVRINIEVIKWVVSGSVEINETATVIKWNIKWFLISKLMNISYYLSIWNKKKNTVFWYLAFGIIIYGIKNQMKCHPCRDSNPTLRHHWRER